MAVIASAPKTYTIPLHIRLTLLLVGTSLIIGIMFVTSYFKTRLLDEVHTSTDIELRTNAISLSSTIDNRMVLSYALRAFALSELSYRPSINSQTFDSFASHLIEGTSGVRNLSIYPDGIAQFVYPLDGNSAILGMDLFKHTDPSILDNALRTRLSDQLTVLGPFELTQGGTGLLSRQSIFINNQFWGFVSVVLDIEPILKEAGLFNENKGIELALRNGSFVIFGDPDLFNHSEHIIKVALPEGHMELAAVPTPHKLSAVNNKMNVVRILCFFSFLLFIYFLYIQLTRKAKLQALVEDRTRELEEQERTVRHMAYHDPLTGLSNRAHFNEQIVTHLEYSAQEDLCFALIYLDIDNLKLINDTLGHYYGDTLLVEIAKRLIDSLDHDEVVSRIGGDEFTVILPNIQDEEHVRAVVRTIFHVFQQPFSIREIEHYITASIGIVIYPDHGTDATTLIKNADSTMYRAKENGKNQFLFFDASINRERNHTVEISNGLRRAMDNHEFQMYYQPQVEATTGKIIGLEALIRWNHPEQGLIAPGHFIPIAEETGLIVPIGEHVLQLVCEQSRAWQEAGYAPIKIAVNLSAKQFRQQTLPYRIKQILEDNGIHPSYIELEITENEAMRGETQLMLHELREMGFIISIDDFGTHYSSLSYLTRLPVDKIKLDRSFVNGIASNPKDEAIILAILLIADRLELTVIAEGVETAEQLSFLVQNQCDQIQGYYFHKPMCAEHVEELLLDRKVWSR
jgi:diguanylate cyclase (GGDEF)-like protein